MAVSAERTDGLPERRLSMARFASAVRSMRFFDGAPMLFAAQIFVNELAELGHGGIVGAEVEQRLLVVRRVLNRLVLHRARA